MNIFCSWDYLLNFVNTCEYNKTLYIMKYNIWLYSLQLFPSTVIFSHDVYLTRIQFSVESVLCRRRTGIPYCLLSFLLLCQLLWQNEKGRSHRAEGMSTSREEEEEMFSNVKNVEMSPPRSNSKDLVA